jgi:hypothetical protein
MGSKNLLTTGSVVSNKRETVEKLGIEAEYTF